MRGEGAGGGEQVGGAISRRCGGEQGQESGHGEGPNARGGGRLPPVPTGSPVQLFALALPRPFWSAAAGLSRSRSPYERQRPNSARSGRSRRPLSGAEPASPGDGRSRVRKRSLLTAASGAKTSLTDAGRGLALRWPVRPFPGEPGRRSPGVSDGSRRRSILPEHPWNLGQIIGPKPPLQPKHIRAIRQQLKNADRIRDLALFNCAVDAKLRGCDLVKLRVCDVAPGGAPRERANVIQQKTGRPVPFEIALPLARRLRPGSKSAAIGRTDGCFRANAAQAIT